MESKEFADIKAMHVTAFDEVMKEKLVPIIGAEVASSVQKTVATLKLQRQEFGHDMTGLDESEKKLFVDTVRASVGFGIREKANEALIEEQDNRGGYLVSREIADAIVRIAASVGTIMSQAAKWEMKTDELAVPNYTGAFLTGAYLGVDAPGTVTGIAFGQAQLIAKKWQLAFVVGNDLLADANVNVADWLLALGGESLANMIDYQGFVGGANTGDPFLGILNLPTSTTIQPNDTNVNKVYLGGSSTSGSTTLLEVRAHGRLVGLDRRSRRVGPRRRGVLHEPLALGEDSRRQGHGRQLHPAFRRIGQADRCGRETIRAAARSSQREKSSATRSTPTGGCRRSALRASTASRTRRATRASSSATWEPSLSETRARCASRSSSPAASAARKSHWQTSAALSTSTATP